MQHGMSLSGMTKVGDLSYLRWVLRALLVAFMLQAFYNGFLPNFARLGTWNVAMFLMLEQVGATYRCTLSREMTYDLVQQAGSLSVATACRCINPCQAATTHNSCRMCAVMSADEGRAGTKVLAEEELNKSAASPVYLLKNRSGLCSGAKGLTMRRTRAKPALNVLLLLFCIFCKVLWALSLCGAVSTQHADLTHAAANVSWCS